MTRQPWDCIHKGERATESFRNTALLDPTHFFNSIIEKNKGKKRTSLNYLNSLECQSGPKLSLAIFPSMNSIE